MGYALYGSDIDETRTPYDAGLGWVVRLDKGDFVGREALRQRRETGPTERLVGFRLLERGFPRPGYAIHSNGEPVGTVTSGTLSPSLGYGIGMGYVAAPHAKPGTLLDIEIRGQPTPAEVVRPPFFTAGSLRR
jgi:aminomethyltransferase